MERLIARLGADGDSCIKSCAGAFDEPQLVSVQIAIEIRAIHRASALFISAKTSQRLPDLIIRIVCHCFELFVVIRPRVDEISIGVCRGGLN